MDRKKNSVQRSLKISEDVLEIVVKYAILSVEGVAGFYKGDRRSRRRPVEMNLNSEFPEITAKINLTGSCKAKSVCENVQRKVRDDVLSMTGIALGAVNIKVEGICGHGI